MSGIVALFFSGICHAHYSYYSVAPESQTALKRFFEFSAFLSETFVFAYLGLQASALGACLHAACSYAVQPSWALNIPKPGSVGLCTVE